MFGFKIIPVVGVVCVIAIFSITSAQALADPELIRQFLQLKAQYEELVKERQEAEAKVSVGQVNQALIEQIKKKIVIQNPFAPNAAFEDQMKTRLARQLTTVPDILKRLTFINLTYKIRPLAPGKTDYVFRGTNKWMEPQDFEMVVEGPNEEELLNTLGHEGEHPCIAFHAGCPVAKGIEEGFATFFGEKPKYVAQHYRDLAAVYPRIFSASQLYGMMDYPQNGTTMLMYSGSTALAEFLFRTLEAAKGPEKTKNAYRNIMIDFTLTAQTEGLDAAMRKYEEKFGFNNVSTYQFEQRYRSFVEKRIQEVGPTPIKK